MFSAWTVPWTYLYMPFPLQDANLQPSEEMVTGLQPEAIHRNTQPLCYRTVIVQHDFSQSY